MSGSNPFRPTDRLLRQFSVLWIIFFAGIAAWQAFVHHRHLLAVILAVLALTIGPLGAAFPRFIKPIFIGWMAIAYPIGWVVSHVILGIVFYALFTPIALLFRLVGRDILTLRPQPGASTCWTPKPQAIDKSQYLHQS